METIRDDLIEVVRETYMSERAFGRHWLWNVIGNKIMTPHTLTDQILQLLKEQ